MRKSRLEGKPSLLPKPRRPGSTDRLSTEARRPSTAGHRSSSADARPTYGSRLSREASATKLNINGRARSVQGEKFGQSSMTPLRSSQYTGRVTATPVRTPSKDRSRGWQASLDRALAFVTVKDHRPISTQAWQRATAARVASSLEARGAGGALVRPLTIARFVDISAALLAALVRDARLNNDNYVTKLPHVAKRLLYPGPVSKSWLKAANTLHAFPHALAFISYLLDLVSHVEMPVEDEWLYVQNDEVSRLRRDYVYKCWIRFQEPEPQFDDLNAGHLHSLRELLGNSKEKIAELQQVIQKYTACLEDPEEAAERASEARVAARRDALAAAARAQRRALLADRAAAADLRERTRQLLERAAALDADIDKAAAESHQLKAELESQPLSVSERARLLDELDYAQRVLDSKTALAEHIGKMVLGKESELALWQKKTLAACVEYKQGLIHLAAQLPHLAALAVDEKELMSAECADWVSRAIEALRECANMLAERRAEHARSKAALARKRSALLEETRTKISSIKESIALGQQELDSAQAQLAAGAEAWAAELAELNSRAVALAAEQKDHDKVQQELEYWEQQDQTWRVKLSEMRDYVASKRSESQRLLAEARARRVALAVETIRVLHQKLTEGPSPAAS